MNKKILIIKNITHENPGLLKSILNENNLQYDLIELDKGETFPNPLDYSALIVLGGPDSANDNTLKMTNELQKIKNAIDSKIPYLGICLGLQTLVKANGGKVIKNDVKEIGFRDPENNFFNINLTDEGKIDPIFKGFNSPLKLFHLHGETVSLGPDMTLLATGKYCKNQVVKVGSNAYGLQGNFELPKREHLVHRQNILLRLRPFLE